MMCILLRDERDSLPLKRANHDILKENFQDMLLIQKKVRMCYFSNFLTDKNMVSE